MNEQNRSARRPFSTTCWAMPRARIEEETQLLINYINDELVPAIRQHSTSALRVASEKLQQAADHMDSRKQKP